MTAPVADRGILAIWHDCRPGDEADYEAWYATEHLPERVAVPGFLVGRRYTSLGDGPRNFIYYELASPEVANSPAYRARLDAPTEWTRRIMSNTFRNMSRTVCRQQIVQGRCNGAFTVTIDLDAADVEADPAEDAREIAAGGGAVRVAVWTAVQTPPGDATTEEQLRGGDNRIAGAIVCDCTSEAQARRLWRLLTEQLPSTRRVGLYQLAIALNTRDVR